MATKARGETLNVQEAAEVSGLHPNTLYKAVQADPQRLPAEKDESGAWKIKPEDLREFVGPSLSEAMEKFAEAFAAFDALDEWYGDVYSRSLRGLANAANEFLETGAELVKFENAEEVAQRERSETFTSALARLIGAAKHMEDVQRLAGLWSELEGETIRRARVLEKAKNREDDAALRQRAEEMERKRQELGS